MITAAKPNKEIGNKTILMILSLRPLSKKNKPIPSPKTKTIDKIYGREVGPPQLIRYILNSPKDYRGKYYYS